MSGAPDTRQWSWWAGLGADAEHFTITESSREAVIAAAEREFGPNARVTIVEATQDGPFTAPDLDDDEMMDVLLDKFSEANCERFGEDGLVDFPRDALAKQLQAAFQAFLVQHGHEIPTYTFIEQRNREVIGPIAPG